MRIHLRATGRHLPYGITQSYLPPNTSECAPPYSTRFTYPRGMEGWVDLGSLTAARPGIEPKITWSHSQVQRPIVTPPSHPCLVLTVLFASLNISVLIVMLVLFISHQACIITVIYVQKHLAASLVSAVCGLCCLPPNPVHNAASSHLSTASCVCKSLNLNSSVQHRHLVDTATNI